MRKRAFTLSLFLGAALLLVQASAQQPGGPGGGGGKGGKGGPFGKGKGGPGQILPPFLQDLLELTADQKKQLETLQKEVDAKLAKILTADQKKQLEEIRERGPKGPKKDGPDGPQKDDYDRPKKDAPDKDGVRESVNLPQIDGVARLESDRLTRNPAQ